MDSLPVYPQRVIQSRQNAALLSFADMAELSKVDREKIINHAAPLTGISAAYVTIHDGEPFYLFVFNREAPIEWIRFALSIEIGNIMMGHIGKLDHATRLAEAYHFARHMCFPRPVIKLCQEMGIPLTYYNINKIAGGYGNYVADLQKVVPSSAPAELNKKVKEIFRPYLESIMDLGLIRLTSEPLLDLSSYMEGYEDEM